MKGASGEKMTLREQIKAESPSVANKINRLKARSEAYKSASTRYQSELARARQEIERLRRQLLELGNA